MSVGEKIRKRRLELGLSLQKVADHIGVTKNAVYLWETNESIEIAVPNLLRLAEVLQMPTSDLLPPRATDPEVTITDPQQKLLIERFRLLSAPQREVYLQMLLVMQTDVPPEN
jgi:transcriptional regulator with XRE-family HTH domain